MGRKEFFYNISPVWVQNFLISIKGFEFEIRRVDRKQTLKHYDFLIKSQFWSEDQIKAYQNQMFLGIVKEAFLNVPYYQKLSKSLQCDFRDFKSIEDIRLLPILEKNQIKGNEIQFVNQKVKKNKLLVGSTSGTTGTPLKLFYSQSSFSNRWAFELRLRNWASLQNIYHPRRIQFTGRDLIPIKNKKNTFWRYNLASNTLHCSSSHVNAETAIHYAKAITAFAPEFVDGYPSAISVLSKICLEKGYLLPKVKAIRVSAETLFNEDRSIIEKAFDSKVYNQYGSSESSCFCSENEFGEMLVHPEFGLFEVLSTENNKDGLEDFGEVITTSFMNPNMPFLRYRIGDLVKPGKGVSSEYGKNFQRLDSVLGRLDDILFIPGRGYVGRLDPVFKGITGIFESQIILESPNLLVLKIVPDSNYSNKIEKKLIDNLKQKVGNELEIKTVFCEKIERGPNGKFITVVDKTKKNVSR